MVAYFIFYGNIKENKENGNNLVRIESNDVGFVEYLSVPYQCLGHVSHVII